MNSLKKSIEKNEVPSDSKKWLTILKNEVITNNSQY